MGNLQVHRDQGIMRHTVLYLHVYSLHHLACTNVYKCVYLLLYRASSVQPSIGSRATSPVNQDERGGAVGGASIHDDDEGDDGGGRIVPTLTIGADGKIVVDESR